ncbi:MAG: alpha/beta hydrolase [Synergistaceae bacterium]|nr:alpha/beta hydrolase [Synergistaceae bacterium]
MNTVSEGHAAAPAKKGHSVLWLVFLLVVLVFSIRPLLPWIVFRPTREHVRTPEAYGLEFEDVTLVTSDGVKLSGWYVPAPEARGTLLFFHGNAGNISHRLDSIEIFHYLGLSVFIVDYRGYGKSEGRRSIPGVTEDALSAWRYLTEERGISPDDIVMFGRSVGGAIAMQLMRYVTPRALILESTFSSLPEMIRVPFLVPAVRFIIGDVFNSAEIASELTVPALFFHSPDDGNVPYRLGRRLYEAAAGEKTFVEISGGHNEGFLESIDVYRPALDEFFTKHFGSYSRPRSDR